LNLGFEAIVQHPLPLQIVINPAYNSGCPTIMPWKPSW